MRTGSIYLDYNATSPPFGEVVEAVAAAMADLCGNASSLHAEGQRAKAALDRAREQVAALLGARPTEIVFTAGGTEADNLAMRGAWSAMAPRGRTGLVVGAVEHEAVLVTARALARAGAGLALAASSSQGVVDPDALAASLDERTALVSLMHANNETGVIQPVEAAAEAAHRAGALAHTDAVQTVGRIGMRPEALGVDLASLSAHKFGGPKGAGALWVRPGTPMAPVLTGGRQERGRRAGTENVPAIVGMGVAAEIAAARLETESARLAALRDRLEQALCAEVPGTVLNGRGAARIPNTSNVSFEGVEAESLVIALDLEGVEASTGAACSSGSVDPSHVLVAMGLEAWRVQGAIRMSLGHATTERDIDRVAAILPRLVGRIRAARA